jgi:hypothetical protein
MNETTRSVIELIEEDLSFDSADEMNDDFFIAMQDSNVFLFCC